MQQLFSIFIFLKPYILWSVGINMVLSFFKYEIIPILIVKLLLVVFLWYLINESKTKVNVLQKSWSFFAKTIWIIIYYLKP